MVMPRDHGNAYGSGRSVGVVRRGPVSLHLYIYPYMAEQGGRIRGDGTNRTTEVGERIRTAGMGGRRWRARDL